MAVSPDPVVQLANTIRMATIDACIDLAQQGKSVELGPELTGAPNEFWLNVANRIFKHSRARFKVAPNQGGT